MFPKWNNKYCRIANSTVIKRVFFLTLVVAGLKDPISKLVKSFSDGYYLRKKHFTFGRKFELGLNPIPTIFR